MFQVILCFVSVVFDAVSLILVSLSRTPKQALISASWLRSYILINTNVTGYGFLALGSGDNPTFKSVFTGLVPKDQNSMSSLHSIPLHPLSPIKSD